MDVTPLICSHQKVIQSYKTGIFKISGEIYNHPVYVTPFNVLLWDVAGELSIADLKPEHFDFLIKQADDIDVVLLGCGKTMVFMPQGLEEAFKFAGLSVDIMDTGAACRTYNVLMAEGRRVACLMIPYL
jgi:uncharacterized protein